MPCRFNDDHKKVFFSEVVEKAEKAENVEGRKEETEEGEVLS